MARHCARTIAAAYATLLLLAPAAAGRGEYADRIATAKGRLEEVGRLSEAVRAGKIDRDVLLVDVCEAVRSDARFADEGRRYAATHLLGSLTRMGAAGRMVIDHPLQLETLLLLSSDARVVMRVNSLQAFGHADGSAELVARIEQRCLEAAQSDESAMVRCAAAKALGELVDQVDDAAWRKWCPEFLRLAGDPVGDQLAEYARIEAADPLHSTRDWQIRFRATFLRSIALREGCGAALIAAEQFDVRGRIAALEGLAKAFLTDLGRSPPKQSAADLAAYAEWVAQAGHWIDVPRLPVMDGEVDEAAGAIEKPLISALQVLALMARRPNCSEALRARIAEVIEQAGATGSEAVQECAKSLRKE